MSAGDRIPAASRRSVARFGFPAYEEAALLFEHQRLALLSRRRHRE